MAEKTYECINFDGMFMEEISAILADPAARDALHPTQLAIARAAQTAQAWRREGEIAKAQVKEEAIEKLYKKLPAELRW
jgi:hypothetical protein